MDQFTLSNVRVVGRDGGLVSGEVDVESGCIRAVRRVVPNNSVGGGDRVDAGGACAVPGFFDAHIHLTALALSASRCDLSGAGSAREVADQLSEWVDGRPDTGAVVGVDWDDSAWPGPELTRGLLDRVGRRRCVLARRVCGHVAVANSALLAALDAPAGFVDRATGRLIEDAVAAASAICAPPPDQLSAGFDAAIARLHALGITGVCDIVSPGNLDAYLNGVETSSRPLRIDALFHAPPTDFDALADRCAGRADGQIRPLGIKVFSDGSFGARTAALHSPYADAATLGAFLLDEPGLDAILGVCARREVVCAVHAIGDRALRAVLLAIHRAGGGTGGRAKACFRIEHAELVGWEELELLSRLQVGLSMQPNFVRRWQGAGGLYERRLGGYRRGRCNPFRALIEAGVPVAFGSDAMPPGPLFGMRGATHHPVESERLTLIEAMGCYTAAAADAIVRRGAGESLLPGPPATLNVGDRADLTLLAGDLCRGDPDALRVVRTYVAGLCVFDAGSGPGRGSVLDTAGAD